MTTTLKFIPDIEYPSSDGLPMAESDLARDYLIYGVEALSQWFQTRTVYVSGNLFIYYEQGNPKAVVAPDVFVVIGVEKKKRLSYKLWEEDNKVPNFVLEITSKSTASDDRGTKRGLYAYLGVKEYFQYDPSSDYLFPALQGFRLVNDNYLPIPAQNDRGVLSVYSQELGLELQHRQDGEMRFYDRESGQTLPNAEEMLQENQIAKKALLVAQQEKSKAEERSIKLAQKLRELGIDPNID